MADTEKALEIQAESEKKNRILFIVNPVAGTMRSRTEMFTVVNIFCKAGYLVNVAVTQKRGHATELAQQADPEEYDIIVCCGGDGTLNETLTGLMRSGKRIPLGYIPAGSTNDFAQTLGIPTDPEKAAKAILRKKPFTIDVGLFNGNSYFSYVASFGAFTSTSYSVPQEIKNTLGHLAYILGGIRDLTTIASYKISLNADGRQYSDTYIFGAICNTRSIAGMLKLPVGDESLHDGKLEILLVKKPESLIELSDMITGITTSDYTGPMFTYFKASRVEISMGKKLSWSLDGEKKDGDSTVVIEAVKNAVELYR